MIRQYIKRSLAILGMAIGIVAADSRPAESAIIGSLHGRPTTEADWSCAILPEYVINQNCSTLTWVIPLLIHSTGNRTFKVNFRSSLGAETRCRAVRFDELNQIVSTEWASTTSSSLATKTMGTINVASGFGAYVECEMAQFASINWVSW